MLPYISAVPSKNCPRSSSPWLSVILEPHCPILSNKCIFLLLRILFLLEYLAGRLLTPQSLKENFPFSKFCLEQLMTPRVAFYKSPDVFSMNGCIYCLWDQPEN